jgi:hypothetical protein
MNCINCSKEVDKFMHGYCKDCYKVFYDKCMCGRKKKICYPKCLKCIRSKNYDTRWDYL